MKLGRFETNNVYCEDSYKAIKDIPDKSIDCIYTDIPYLYNQGGSGSSELGQRTAKKRLELMGLDANYMEEKGKTRGDALRIAKNIKKTNLNVTSIEDGIDYSILDEFVRVMKKVNIFIWCSKLQLLDIMKYFIDKHQCLFELLVWNKTNPTPSTNNSWLPDIEYCLYFREKGVPLNDGYDYKSKWFTSPANVRDKELYMHPTIKPIELVKRHLEHTTKGGQIVADFFMGSGTTCVACKDLGRQYIGFEINPKWHKVAYDRLNNKELKMTEVESKIFEKMKEIKSILEENGETEYFNAGIINGNISFNNEYWNKTPEETKIRVNLQDGVVVIGGGEWL